MRLPRCRQWHESRICGMRLRAPPFLGISSLDLGRSPRGGAASFVAGEQMTDDDHTRFLRGFLAAHTDLEVLPHAGPARRVMLAVALAGPGCSSGQVHWVYDGVSPLGSGQSRDVDIQPTLQPMMIFSDATSPRGGVHGQCADP